MGFLKNLISSNKNDMSVEGTVEQGLLIFDALMMLFMPRQR